MGFNLTCGHWLADNCSSFTQPGIDILAGFIALFVFGLIFLCFIYNCRQRSKVYYWLFFTNQPSILDTQFIDPIAPKYGYLDKTLI
jgi:hypothetical protein